MRLESVIFSLVYDNTRKCGNSTDSTLPVEKFILYDT